MTYNWCRTWNMDVDQYNLVPCLDANKENNEKWWAIYERETFSKETLDLRNAIEEYVGPIEYMGVWDYYEGFVDDLGPHVDTGSIENAVVFFCPRGELTVTMHDKETKEVLESRVLNNKNAMCLYHTEFMHDIQGVGDLVVFGLNKSFDEKTYFRK